MELGISFIKVYKIYVIWVYVTRIYTSIRVRARENGGRMEDRESTVEARLRVGVANAGGKAYKWVSPGNAGVPDRLVIMPGGRVYFVELKKVGGRLSARQKAQIRKLTSRGCEVRVLIGADQVDEFLREIGGVAGGA